MRKAYPSDISRAQFEHIREELENFKKTTKPRKVDLYDVFCAILYLIKTGCQWRAIPHDFPKWNLVYFYYKEWGKRGENGEESLLDRLQTKLVERIRQDAGKQATTTFLIVDSQSVKNTDTAKKKGTMQVKKSLG